MITLLNVAEMLSKKTQNLPFGNVKAADPHKVIPMELRGKGLISVGSNEIGREGSGDGVDINGFFGEFYYKEEQ